MPIDLLNEQVVTFAEAANALPSLSGGKPIDRSTFLPLVARYVGQPQTAGSHG